MSLLEYVINSFVDIAIDQQDAEKLYSQLFSIGICGVIYLKEDSIERKKYGLLIDCEFIYPPQNQHDTENNVSRTNLYCIAYSFDGDSQERFELKNYGLPLESISKVSVSTIRIPAGKPIVIDAPKITKEQFTRMADLFFERQRKSRNDSPGFEKIKYAAFELFKKYSAICDEKYIKVILDSISSNPYLTEYYLNFKLEYEKLSEAETLILGNAKSLLAANNLRIFIEEAKKSKTKSNANQEQALRIAEFMQKFRPSILLEASIPVYIDAKGISHILCRHLMHFYSDNDGTKFDCEAFEILKLIEKVLDHNADEIRTTIGKNGHAKIRRAGKLSLFCQGRFYSMNIEESGRISCFYHKVSRYHK